MEIAKMLIASTAHVTDRERATLDENGYSRGEYGWLIYTGEPGDSVLPEFDELSPGLTGVLEAARRTDCRYVLLDRDADELAGVPTYNWLED